MLGRILNTLNVIPTLHLLFNV